MIHVSAQKSKERQSNRTAISCLALFLTRRSSSEVFETIRQQNDFRKRIADGAVRPTMVPAAIIPKFIGLNGQLEGPVLGVVDIVIVLFVVGILEKC